jgi:hypothetical protein
VRNGGAGKEENGREKLLHHHGTSESGDSDLNLRPGSGKIEPGPVRVRVTVP